MTAPAAASQPAVWRPSTRREALAALAALAEHGDEVKVVAGATAFTIAAKAGLLSARRLVCCAQIPDLRGVWPRDDGLLRIGAATRLREVEQHRAVRSRLPVLAATISAVANLRVRNAATIGGNLAEADYSSDPPCVLTALDGRVRLESAAGSRWLRLTEFFTDYYETAIRSDELLTDVEAAPLPAGWHGVYLKCTSRSSDDRTCLGIAALVDVDVAGRCAGARLCVIGAGPTPLRLPEAERQCVGAGEADLVWDTLADAYVSAADPVSDVRGSAAYRKRLMRALIPRAARAAAAGRTGVLRA